MLMQPFLCKRTLGEICDILEDNKMNVAKTERELGVKRGQLDCKIKSKKFLQFFKDRYPKRFPESTLVRTSHTCAVDVEMVVREIPCMTPGCHRYARVLLAVGDPIPRGMRKWCEQCKFANGEIAAGCIQLDQCSGGADEQIGGW